VAIDWHKVREDYGQGGLSFETLGASYGCKAETIKRRARREGWGAVNQNAAKAELKREDIIGEHRRFWSVVKGRLNTGLASSNIDELKMAKIAGDVVLNIQKGEAQAWGLTEDDIRTDRAEVLGITREMAESTISPRTGEALDGDETL
jgi:hypothetical protein